MRKTVMLASAAVICLASGLLPSTPAGALLGRDPYANDPYTVTTDATTFGQAPVFMPDGRVVYGKNFKQGAGTQVYMSNQDGSGLTCLTCALGSTNNVPAVRPQGDWILFHSWIGRRITLGSPGYGGLGSALWVMHPDGTHATQLTETQPGFGAQEGYDDYHAYWSPDGKELVWAHLDWNFVTGGGQGKWDVRVGDFSVSPGGVPTLSNIRVVLPANGSWYETQWWAPDGSGFLYTQTSGTTMDTELFFCRLVQAGCIVTQLTDSASWNEQAIFTPNMRDVIFMSSRDHPGAFNTFVQLARAAHLSTSEDYLLTLEIFEGAFEQPIAQESTDLYELNLATGSVRRLTTDGNDGWIIPEFTWDPTHAALVWTEQRFPTGVRVPLPLNPIAQLQADAQLLEHPPLGSLSIQTSNLLEPSLPLEARTRILRLY
jgi:hypothetical protein